MRWEVLAAISAVAAGLTSVFAKAGLEDVPSHLGNAVRTFIVLSLSLAILWWSGEHEKAGVLTRRAWMFLFFSAVATAVSWVAFFKALSMGSATSVSAVDKASLVVTMICAFAFLGEQLTWKAAVGVALIVGGSLLASSGTR